ncbi:hypothetical protein OR1_03369 [Geobacter sp. OR-1]|uniref:MtrB/PioB family outer membrane beta-barrel protein n=1 Tax=Geobacter sp. OR-1 TaxID=1266765 RepID=UPI000542688B|nr:MtrB/PioB family outer membrane beta-barrel protein [Geobacter sp. OR-1]GAM11061.1 hypothetical protein OR1_03369 [Geobacter sp. OR-1]
MPRFSIAAVMISGIITVLFGSAATVGADDAKPDEQDSVVIDHPLPVSLEATETTDLEAVELPVSEIKVETHKSLTASAGYRFMGFDGYGGRAAEYDDLHSGPTFVFMDSILGRDHKFVVDGAYVTENDYFANLSYDYMGAYRAQLRTESLYHNLDRYTLTAPSFYSVDQKDSGRFGLRVEQDLASLRARMGSYPIHLNLQYWRILKQGDSQLRFADLAFFPVTAANKLSSVRRRIDHETHEGKLGFDAHVGPLDFIYDFTIRQYSDHADTPVDAYVARLDPSKPGYYQRSSGSYEHDESPSSRYLAHNIKIHTEQTGGIVAAAAYTIAQRKNLSSLTQVSGANGLTDTLQTGAGDLVYTPCKEFSTSLRFRHQEIARDTASITALNFITPNPGNVIRANTGINMQKDVLSAIVSFRPVNDFTVKGEYQGEYIHRENTDSWDPFGKLSGITVPSNSERHKGILTILSKPVKNLRLKARYSYTTYNQPEYGISFDERHDGQLLATYTLKDKYGFSASYQISHNFNDASAVRRLDLVSPNFDPVPVYREKRQIGTTATLWGNLLNGRISLTGTTGLLRSSADQQVLFSSVSNQNTATVANYTSQSLLYGITIAVRPLEKLDTFLSFQQIRSFAEFDPTSTQIVNASGVKEISDLKTVENSLNFKVDYRLFKNISCGVDYRYQEYSDDRNSMFDGSVHSVITSFTAKW